MLVINEEHKRLERCPSKKKSDIEINTTVSAYKFGSSGFEAFDELRLAIVHKKDPNYQLLLYEGEQSAVTVTVTVANISPRFDFRVQQDNYASFVDEGNISWTICFDSQDILIKFAKQLLLCKACSGRRRWSAVTWSCERRGRWSWGIDLRCR